MVERVDDGVGCRESLVLERTVRGDLAGDVLEDAEVPQKPPGWYGRRVSGHASNKRRLSIERKEVDVPSIRGTTMSALASWEVSSQALV